MASALHEREQLLTVAEVAMELGCSAPTVRRWIHEGHLAALKLGPGRAGLVRIPRSAVDETVPRNRRVTFDPLEPCPGATGQGCPHGSVIDPSRVLCHTCRKDQRRQAPEGVGTSPLDVLERETVESSGFLGVRVEAAC